MSTETQVKEYYDEFADVYDIKHGVSLYGQTYNFCNYYEPFLKRVLPKEGKVLELGCGTGVYTQWLGQQGHTVCAMDISDKMIEHARERNPAASYFLGNCEDPASVIPTDVIGEGFDCIVGFNTFSYYHDKQQALNNYYKILRPGARFIVIDMNGASPFYWLMSIAKKNEMGEWLGEIRASNEKSLRKMLGQAGFKIGTFEHFAFIPNGLGKTAVKILSIFDKVLNALPFTNWFAMRVAYCVTKE